MRSCKSRRRRRLVCDHPKFLRILRSVRVSPQKRKVKTIFGLDLTSINRRVEAGWSELPDELLSLIVRRLGSTADFVRLRGICWSWQSAAAASKDNFVRGREFPWLMLSDEHDPNSTTRRFFSLTDGKTYNVLLPEARRVRSCGSTDGWLITLDIQENMSLLNPLSRTQIPLPPLETFRAGDGYGFLPEHKVRISIKKVILSCPPSPDSSHSASVALALYSSFRGSKLAFARVGTDKEWCAIESDYRPYYEDAVHYNGRFYAVGRSGKVVVCNIQGVGSSNAQLVSSSPTDNVMDPTDTVLGLDLYPRRYLVESSSGRLLQVARKWVYIDDFLRTTDFKLLRIFHRTTDFKVFELDLGCGEWRRLKSLGGDSLFLGFNQSMSVKASNIPGCRANCIYFTDDHLEEEERWPTRMGHDMGIFSLEDRSIQPHFQGYSYSRISPPLWVVPNLC